MKGVHDLVRRTMPGEVVMHSESLTGGVSARVTALILRKPDGQERRVVVREYGERDLRANPDVAAQEYALLSFLNTQGMPVPQPLAHAPGVLVQTFMAGQSGAEVGADPVQLARFLARVHALEPAAVPLRPLANVPPASGPPDDSLSESVIRAALAAHPPPPGRTTLLHGDLWPGNTLWQAGSLSAVLDWEDAAQGNPLYDLSTARLELLFFSGHEAMQAFTVEYIGVTGTAVCDLPVWDLRAALRPCGRMQDWGLEAATEAQMRGRHAEFVLAALAAPRPS
ncbi:aminoglycoside phosphotransferase family protein [Deinococcus sp.]|uniref:phosphotransferase family protein n=1 Tax=Deinococcus sp. TaxID=47478 RepID=UPI002869B8FC|nr:aminoglycoside phosphotransferase family protein [Deinococcus sp.]